MSLHPGSFRSGNLVVLIPAAICLIALRKIALPPGNREFWAGDLARVLPVPAESAGVPVRGVVPEEVMST
jgi:hypothetical protein